MYELSLLLRFHALELDDHLLINQDAKKPKRWPNITMLSYVTRLLLWGPGGTNLLIYSAIIVYKFHKIHEALGNLRN